MGQVVDSNKVGSILAACVARLNEQLPAELRVAAEPQTALTGEGSRLDSLSLVTLLADAEDALEREFGAAPRLLDEALMGSDTPAFTTLEDLTRWIVAHGAAQ